MIYLAKGFKPDVWVFYDLDQTVIDTYKNEKGEPYVDKNGKPLFTREVWADVLYKESVIDQRDFTYLGEPWLMLARGELTNERAAQESNKRYLEIMKGKKYSDLVYIAKTKLAPRVVLKSFVAPVYAFFEKHSNPKFCPVTNVYDEVCQGLNDAGVLKHPFRISNKPKFVDGRMVGDCYDMDVSQSKKPHVQDFLRENKIPYEHTFAFIDRYPQDDWGGECRFLYGVGPDKDTKKFVKLYKGKMVLEGKRGIKELVGSLSQDIGSLIVGENA